MSDQSESAIEHESPFNSNQAFFAVLANFFGIPFVGGTLLTIFVYPSPQYDPPAWHTGSLVLVGILMTGLTLYLMGLERRGCGCIVWPTDWGYAVVETTDKWVREEVGSKIQYRKERTELRRCEHCGDHYHQSIDEPVEVREGWEEEEPEIMPSEPTEMNTCE